MDMSFSDEADFMGQIRPGIDGLIISDGPNAALFLPSVWSQLPRAEDFISRLKTKAGLSADHWSPTFSVKRFITGEVKQSDLPEPQSIWT
jgi:AMMECR1 domain-containing protein